MSTNVRDFESKPRRALGPVIVAVLFLFASCGVSLDFILTQLRERNLIAAAEEVPANSNALATNDPAGLSGSILSAPSEGPLDHSSPESDRSSSVLPAAVPWPDLPEPRRRAGARGPAATDFEEPIAMAKPREPAQAEFNYESQPEDLKISLEPSAWKGGSQLLPEPMYVSQLDQKKSLDIRGGGWVAIDVAKSRVVPVELFKAPQRADNERRVIEAKYVGGHDVVNPKNAGFPIVRGIPGLQPGGFEVFENPPCLVRYSGVSEEEICEVTLGSLKVRYKFEPPALAPEEPVPDFIFSKVSIDMGRGQWKQIVTFNESFHPIGDPNRDGYPDFYVESVTGYDESGSHVLLMSKRVGDDVDYVSHLARFKGR